MASQVRLFSKDQELLNLAIPVVFLAAALKFDITAVPDANRMWFPFVYSFLGLNIVHNAFSFAMLRLPEFKTWRHERSQLSWLDRSRTWVILIAVLFLYFQLKPGLVRVLGANAKSVDTALNLIAIYFAIGHGLWQNFGLSMLYNRIARQDGVWNSEEIQTATQIEKWERRLYKPFCYLGPFAFIFANELDGAGLKWAALVGYLLMALAIIALTWSYPGRRLAHKIVFQMRLLLIPMLLYNMLAIVAIGFVHGYEYWCVYSKMVNNSRDRKNLSRLYWAVSLTCMILILAIFRPLEIGGPALFYKFLPDFPPHWRTFLGQTSLALTFVHYFIDSRIYHFSDPTTRQHIAPLLMRGAQKASVP